MPRKPRVFVEGGAYHVYCRTGRGARVFDEAEEAAAFVEVLRKVKERDGFLLYAWCLMGSHYHLAVRTTRVPLWRSMASLHVTVSKGFNRRHKVFGPLWQGRYRAKIVMEERYLQQLILYIHLNPVVAGVVTAAGDYEWSGHLELTGARERGLVDVDDALAGFGGRRSRARRAYLKRMETGRGLEWAERAPGDLPWWGRSGEKGGQISPTEGVPYVDYLGRSTAPERPRLEGAEYVARASAALGVGVEELAGRHRGPRLLALRQAVAMVGVERCGQKVKELSRRLHKNPGTISRWVSEAAARMGSDPELARAVERLDLALREASGTVGRPEDTTS